MSYHFSQNETKFFLQMYNFYKLFYQIQSDSYKYTPSQSQSNSQSVVSSIFIISKFV